MIAMMKGTACHSQYTGKEELNELQVWILVVINVLLIILNVAFNSYVILMMRQSNQMKTMSQRFIVYLSLSDLTLALTVQIFFIVLLTRYSQNDECSFEWVASFFGNFLAHVSHYWTFVIGWDRYARINHLLDYSAKFERLRYECAAGVVVITMSLLHAVIHTLGSLGVIAIQMSRKVSLAVNVITIFLMVISYACSIVVVRRHKRNLTTARSLQTIGKFIHVAGKVLLTILVIDVIYIVLQFTSHALYPRVSVENRKWVLFMKLCAFPLYYSNSVINAILIITSNSSLKNNIAHFINNKTTTAEEVTIKEQTSL